jgi:nitrogen fixation-related uncharacterized protein
VDVVIVLVFISLVLVAGAILLFLNGVKGGDFDHGDRLSLLPLEGDESVRPEKGTKAVPRDRKEMREESARQ